MVNLLTPEQAAEHLRVAPETLAVWRCTGRYDLKFVKIGSRVFYDESDIEEFIQNRKTKQTA